MCSRSLWSSAAAKNWLTLRLSPPPYGRHLSAKKNLRETEITEQVGYAVNACLGLIFRGNATPNTGAVACFSHSWWNRVNCDIYECRCTIFVGVSSILKQYIYIYTDMMIWIFVMIHYATTATILLYYTVAHRLIISGDLRYAERILSGTFSFWVIPSRKDFCLKKMPIDLYTLGPLGHA